MDEIKDKAYFRYMDAVIDSMPEELPEDDHNLCAIIVEDDAPDANRSEFVVTKRKKFKHRRLIFILGVLGLILWGLFSVLSSLWPILIAIPVISSVGFNPSRIMRSGTRLL